MRYLIFYMLLCIPILSQRSDFYDTYDYDLRNQKVETGQEDSYQLYNLPAKRPKRELIDPKKVQKDFDVSALIPQNSPFRSAPTNVNPNSSPVNVFTGEINVQAILKNQEDKKREKEAKLKALEDFERPVYKESDFRRGEIIFLMTLPFALGASSILVGLFELNQTGFIKTPTAALIVGFGSIGLSIGNVWLDYHRNLEYREDKRLNPSLPRPFEFSIPVFQIKF